MNNFVTNNLDIGPEIHSIKPTMSHLPQVDEWDEDDGEPFLSQAANNGEQEQDTTHAEASPQADNLLDAWIKAAVVLDDTVHGTLRLHPGCAPIIYTPQFQRLDRLKQLGVAHRVFPSAGHTRLSHSLGVSHLCTELLHGLLVRQRGDLDLDERDIRNVALAGLCHDLGHGPLSHVFEKEFLRRSCVENWEHEDMSLKMFEHLLEDNGIQGLEREDTRFIEQLIKGAKSAERARWPQGKRFLFDIVSNDYNGIDMDRADYLQRDAHQCGVRFRISCEFDKLISSTRVVEDQICYPLSLQHEVWGVYSERVKLFQEVYTHRRTKAAELMAVDALMEADKALRFSTKIHSAEEYMTLDDGLLQIIEHYQRHHADAFQRLSGAGQRSLREAQAILRLLHRGELYDCCGECEVPERMLRDGTWEARRREFTSAELVSCSGGQLREHDVMVDENRIDYGKGGADPMATVGFYEADGNDYVKVGANLSELAGRPSNFKIRTLRVFVRKPENRGAAAAALREWCRQRLGGDVRVDTDVTTAAEAAVHKRGAMDALTPRLALAEAVRPKPHAPVRAPKPNETFEPPPSASVPSAEAADLRRPAGATTPPTPLQHPLQHQGGTKKVRTEVANNTVPVSTSSDDS